MSTTESFLLDTTGTQVVSEAVFREAAQEVQYFHPSYLIGLRITTESDDVAQSTPKPTP